MVYEIFNVPPQHHSNAASWYHQHLLKLGCCSKRLDRWHLDLESICFPHAHWRPDSGILSLGLTAAAADPVPMKGDLSGGCALEEQAQSLQGTLIYYDLRC